jgi:uncharacterized Fe-S cluster-containing radical SAM superfamily protein
VVQAVTRSTDLTIIDTEKFSANLRSRGVNHDQKQILVTKFSGSEQEKDLSLPANCGGFGRIHHFYRKQAPGWPDNPLPIDPALHALGLTHADSIKAQVFQNAICSWRCWYCFVDFDLLSANQNYSAFRTAGDLLDLYLAEPERPVLIDLSGGQPDLVPEWLLWFVGELDQRGLASRTYLWSDDNLSNDYLWRFLRADEIARITSFKNYGRVGCFKGFDSHSFAFNTKADPALYSQQFRLMKRLVSAGFDVYGYVTFTSDSDTNLPRHMADFVDRLQAEVHPIFPLRTSPLKIGVFTPTHPRVGDAQRRSLEVQEEAVSLWLSELQKRFPAEIRTKPVYEQLLTPNPDSQQPLPARISGASD